MDVELEICRIIFFLKWNKVIIIIGMVIKRRVMVLLIMYVVVRVIGFDLDFDRLM